MLWTIAIEILILWACYAAYMAVLVHKRGPIGGLFFYPQAMIDRVKALGLITEAEFHGRKRFAFALLIAWMLVIPGTEDLNDTWHSVHVKQWKLLKLIPFSVPLAAAVGGLYWLIGRMM